MHHDFQGSRQTAVGGWRSGGRPQCSHYQSRQGRLQSRRPMPVQGLRQVWVNFGGNMPSFGDNLNLWPALIQCIFVPKTIHLGTTAHQKLQTLCKMKGAWRNSWTAKMYISSAWCFQPKWTQDPKRCDLICSIMICVRSSPWYATPWNCNSDKNWLEHFNNPRHMRTCHSNIADQNLMKKKQPTLYC